MANTKEDSRNYTACQLLCWYRSNELWKISGKYGRLYPARLFRVRHRPVKSLARRLSCAGKLEHDLGSVRLDRPDGDSQRGRDLLIRFPLGQAGRFQSREEWFGLPPARLADAGFWS
jgi:hypothetical protein